jgi:hypothetical protein
MPPKESRPWLVSERTRKGPQGRPRTGPNGVAVRELDRVTIRARAAVLAQWDALREAEQLPPHDMFEALVTGYLNRMEPERRSALIRTARRRVAERYRNTP